MSEKFANLGSVAVLDANNLVVGCCVDIGGEVLMVDKIIGINVYFRPLTKWERIRYTWSQFSLMGKCLICVILLSVGAILIYEFWH